MLDRKKPGPKSKQQGPRKEFHLKFSIEIADHIEKKASQRGYQAYFDEIVRRDMEELEQVKNEQ